MTKWCIQGCSTYNRVQMFEPFKIGINIYLEQSVWAELSWNPFRKRIALICFGPNHSGEKISGQNFDFWKSYFQFLRRNWVFWSNMENNAVVTLHFEDLAVKIYIYFFLKMYAFIEKSQIVYKGTIDESQRSSSFIFLS